MKSKYFRSCVSISLLMMVWIVFISGSFAFSQGTAFTYQGRLNNAGNLANGNFDFTFSLFDTNAGGNQVANIITNSNTAVSNGLFIVTLDFGCGVFAGSNLWLEIAVRPTGTNITFSTLSPRQSILATPYAVYAQTAGGIIAGGITGVPNMQVFTNSGIFIVPSGVNKIMVGVWGGGGGGGNGGISVCSAGGGGGGGFGKDVFNVTPGATFTVTVGIGGGAGQSGGSSSFGPLISASGGGAGGSALQNSPPPGGGAGGTSSATFNSNGANGSGGALGSIGNQVFVYVAGGTGGAAGGEGGGGGGGGAAGTLNSLGGNGGNGSSPGGGGGGAGEGGVSAATGGVGGNGRVVVYW